MKTFKPRFRPSRRAFLGNTGALVVGLTFLPRLSLSQEEKQLNFYNWDTYIGETTLEDFRAESGIEVKMDLFADNDELFAKLRAGNPGYDVIVPTNDYTERMIAAKMLIGMPTAPRVHPVSAAPQPCARMNSAGNQPTIA